MSLRADTYTDPRWVEADRQAVLARAWQWICHVEKLRAPGSYVSATVAEMPIAIVRDRTGGLRAFYNVCKHRAHELLIGSGTTRNIVCPYHAWTYGLDGQLRAARRADKMETFDKGEICLDQVQVKEFGGFVYVNLDRTAAPLGEQAGDLAQDIARWAPDVDRLTHAKRLTCDVATNWKRGEDPRHLVQPLRRGRQAPQLGVRRLGGVSHPARGVVAVAEHLPFCAARARGNFMVFQVLPTGADRTLETWDFYFETAELVDAEVQSVRYVDEVLQQQDISPVESVQRGMSTPAFDQGRIVYDPIGSGLSEHGVHHFHGLVLDAYRSWLEGTPMGADVHRRGQLPTLTA
jgi:carnitine monooxygenase subunit